ncbi:endolytic transglycosylase MltG [Liquorilactobacillus nagelii]|uniref:endolytic transglycosylase MltG n=2 Tax=Liquorilactobacillus nagelii TaxID=82688 RepID=UPI0006EFE8CC|nr:aminodeoxychorismate lyase [Liquorilactobacillus nagelii DSM 13675]MCC7615469.1 ABC transporter substrate-binding protein [Liquorilactobacillus nagelii]MCP9314660.1 endolytic transglycosylase MltG [Liquorilactobacillus nagelii]QYH53656.1 endolytic transglycosylase MltG [Liquorilactobacillus nagelii DSM 13675]
MKLKFKKNTVADGKKTSATSPLAKRIVVGIIGLIVILIAVIGFQAYHFFNQAMKPLDPKSEKITEIKIPIGSTNKQIGNILEDKKIIKSGFVFDYYVKKHNLGQFKAGYYELKPSMTLKTIAKKLEKGGASQSIKSGKVLVREGVTADQIGDVIQKRTKYSKASFLKLLNNQQFINKLAKKYPELLSSAVQAKNVRYRLEGYLYPATYYLNKNESLKQLIEEMVVKSNQMLTPYYDQIKKKNWTVQKVLTLASLVEREGVTANDRYRIAGVFENRLDAGMMIQSDISVLYALGKHKTSVSYKDLKVNSPYNLYRHQGVGPGPFNNPSIESVNAVLNPTDRDQHYLYFIANMKTGKVYYSKTYAEHQELTQKLEKQNN